MLYEALACKTFGRLDAAFQHEIGQYPVNQIFKFADDTYLVVPDTSTDTCQEDINHLQTWAAENNLRLNRDITKDIVFTSSRKRMLPACHRHVRVLSA